MASVVSKVKRPSGRPTLSEKELREQLQQEIENKSKSCSNPTYACSIPRIDGYEYCIRHILRDPRGHYKQCMYLYSNGKKCINAVPKYDTKKDPAMTTLCYEHSRQAQLLKTHATVGNLRRKETNEALLQNLSHHLNVKEMPERKFGSDQEEEIDVVSQHIDPFVSYEHINNPSTVLDKQRKRRRILDYASDDHTDADEPPTMLNTSRGYEFDDSDNESVDSTSSDLLKHAGIFTRQEAIRIAENKLTKLQGLYMEQINRLHYTLKERRRRYLIEIRKEREQHCSIHDQERTTSQERRQYEQLKALNGYHRRHGMAAVLYKKFKEKRSRAGEAYVQKVSSFTRCTYTEGGVRCANRSLPCCKHCRKHILQDKKQILFSACGKETSGVICQEPIPQIFENSTCVLHMAIPAKREYNLKKYESESEDGVEEGFAVKVEKRVAPSRSGRPNRRRKAKSGARRSRPARRNYAANREATTKALNSSLPCTITSSDMASNIKPITSTIVSAVNTNIENKTSTILINPHTTIAAYKRTATTTSATPMIAPMNPVAPITRAALLSSNTTSST